MSEFRPETPAVFIGVDISGVTHYRVMLPARELRASMLVRTEDLQGMKLVGDVEAPVAVYSMPRADDMIDECQQIMANPKRSLIVDIDDCLRAVVESGAHAASQEWAKILDKHEWLLARADAVTCTTPFLADYARSCGQENVHVIPNALDLERWSHRRFARDRKKTIVGWSGAGGHDEALAEYLPAIQDLLRRRDDIDIVSIGNPIVKHFPEDLHDRVFHMPFVSLAKHAMVLTQFHINIGPALHTDFYRAKSDLRAIEAMASDSLFIGASPTYDKVWLKSGGMVIVNHPAEMAKYIELAIANGKWDHDTRKKGVKWVRENRTIAHTAPLWRAAIESVLKS